MKKWLATILVTLIIVNIVLGIGMVQKTIYLNQLQEDLEWEELEAIEHWYE